MYLVNQLLALFFACLAPGDYFLQRLGDSWSAGPDSRASLKLAAAEQLFGERCYARAGDIFRQLADNDRNDPCLCERARFMQAESLRMRDLDPLAVNAYLRHLDEFPTGRHRDESCNRIFTIAMHWLDDFRDEIQPREKPVIRWRIPGDPRKPLIRQERRAIDALYMVYVHDTFGPHADEALFWCGYVCYVRSDFAEADRYFTQLVEIHKDSPRRLLANTLRLHARSKLPRKPE